jgi:hypothetical protein
LRTEDIPGIVDWVICYIAESGKRCGESASRKVVSPIDEEAGGEESAFFEGFCGYGTGGSD